MSRKPVRVVLTLSLLLLLLVIATARLSAHPYSVPSRGGENALGGPVMVAAGTPLGGPTPSSEPPLPGPGGAFDAGPAPYAGPGTTRPARRIPAPLREPLAPHAAFLVETYPDQYVRYLPSSETPDEWLYVGDVTGSAYYAGDFVGRDYSQVYAIEFNLQELHALDTDSGAVTSIGPCLPVSGQLWTGAAGTGAGMLYATSSDGTTSYLYTVDISTGTASVVGQITNAPGIIDIAANAEGEIYGLDVTSDSLVQIDPLTAAGTVIGSIGFNADYAQSMDFEETSGVLYLAAYNVTGSQGELRTASTATGATFLIGPFPDGAQVDALAFTPPPAQVLQNRGFEGGWPPWHAEGTPFLSGTSYSGSWSVNLAGEEGWVWQELSIPADVLEVTIGYWLTGISADTEWDNDILCGSIWDLSRQTSYAEACFGLTYFYYEPMEWNERIYRLEADEVAGIAGHTVAVGFRLTQDWNPGYHDTSTAWLDDTALYVTRPIYDHHVALPLIIGQ